MAHRTLTGVAALAMTLLGIAGCTQEAMPPAPRVILVGVDGADWALLDPLIAEGRLPSFARLKSEGASGRLRAFEPIFSPVIWATIATGQSPSKHGIESFTVQLDGKPVPVTSNLFRVPRLWEILGGHDRTVGVVGWWTTWPATPVNGFLCTERTWPIVIGPDGWAVTTEHAAEVSRRTYPETLQEQIASHIVTRHTLTSSHLARVNVAGALGTVGGRGPSVADMYAKDLTFLAIAGELYPGVRPDFFTVYFELPDVMAHYFWDFWRYYRYRRYGEPTAFSEPPLGATPEAAVEIGRNYERSYEFVDEALGKLLALADDSTLVMVVSDHGYGENPDGRQLRVGDDIYAANPHWHVLDGVILAWGYGVRPGTELAEASVFDVTPTVLYAMGVPVGRDMEGEVLTGLFDPAFARRAIAWTPTHGMAEGTRAPLPSPENEEYLELLRSLGYVR